MTQQQIKTMLADPSTRSQALDNIGEWAKNNCLMQGASPSTAYVVAWLLVEGISATWEGRKPDYGVSR